MLFFLMSVYYPPRDKDDCEWQWWEMQTEFADLGTCVCVCVCLINEAYQIQIYMGVRDQQFAEASVANVLEGKELPKQMLVYSS